MKMAFSLQTPIGYAIAGSFFLHMVLVSMYATLLKSNEWNPPPPPVKKFKIEMVDRKPKLVNKVPIIEKKIKEPEMVAPVKIKKLHTAYSAKKIKQTEVAMQPVPPMVPAKPKRVQKNKVHTSRKSFQMAKASISAHPVDSRPLKVENTQIQENIVAKVQRPFKGRAKPADISPLPRPVENARTVFKLTRKQVNFHASSAGFAQSLPTSKPFSAARFSSHARRNPVGIRDDREITAHTLFQARALAGATIPATNSDTENHKKIGMVQKGKLVAAARVPSPRPVPDIADPRILDGYLGTLQKLIASAKQYPESARKSGQEGKATVKFTVLQNGTVKNIQLVSKTNYRDLDEEAIAAVKRAAPFSDFPEEIGKPFLDIILPFRFKLNE